MRTFPLWIFRTLLLGLVLAGSIQAFTIQVPGDQPTIQAAVDVAVDGDTILLAAGVYVGEGNRDVLVTQKQVLVVCDGSGGVTVDCAGSAVEPHRAFLIERAEVELVNLRIINGYIPEVCTTCSGHSGGAIYIHDSSVVTLRNCVIDSNYAWYKGGGVYCDTSALVIDSCSFSGNKGDRYWGGALAAKNVSPLVISASGFSGNWHSSGGGALAIEAVPNALITRSIFEANEAKSGGGALQVSLSTVQLSECEFEGNAAGGGAVMGASNSVIEIDSCFFLNNQTGVAALQRESALDAELTTLGVSFEDEPYPFKEIPDFASGSLQDEQGPNGNGGALYVSGCVIHLRRSLFDGNHSVTKGGAIFQSGGQLYIDSCLFTNNSAGYEGGAIDGAGSPIAISRCDFVNNSAASAGGAILFGAGTGTTVDSCRFDRNSATNWGGGILAAQGDYAVRSCLFTNNLVQNYRGSGLYFADCSATVENCSLVGNRGGIGATIALDGSNPLVNRCLIAYSPTDLSFYRYDTLSMPSISCTDIYGNAGGDWIDFIADQQAINGNMSVHPLLCDTANGNYAVAYESVCAPVNNICGQLIGAVEPGCGCCVARGDVNHSGTAGQGEVIVSDLTYLVNYLFRGGEAPPCLIEADVNGSGGGTNASDLTYLVAFLFRGGAAPGGCP